MLLQIFYAALHTSSALKNFIESPRFYCWFYDWTQIISMSTESEIEITTIGTGGDLNSHRNQTFKAVCFPKTFIFHLSHKKVLQYMKSWAQPGGGQTGHAPHKFLAYFIILCIERRFPKQNTVAFHFLRFILLKFVIGSYLITIYSFICNLC